jgi:SAM-dependent MidA family methyltransferase
MLAAKHRAVRRTRGGKDAAMTTSASSEEFLRAFTAQAGATGTISFAEFMALALYHPTLGYYSRTKRRIGYGGESDFFTASTSGPVFGELVSAACVALLGPQAAREHTFVEIGAETRGGVLAGVDHSFAGVRVVQLGDRLELTGPCIVFSNELFDAQPFRRFRFRNGGWRELGVKAEDGTLAETELPLPRGALPPGLPAVAPAGYLIDAPLAAVALAESIAEQPWTGLFLAFDYGKSWRELIEATPAGTARAYFRHVQSNDLLARPGEQDLTCHICWDWLADALSRSGFRSPAVVSQESFFVRHAESYIAPAIAADASQLTPRKQSLLQLLHGAHLGQKFQVLHAMR